MGAGVRRAGDILECGLNFDSTKPRVRVGTSFKHAFKIRLDEILVKDTWTAV